MFCFPFGLFNSLKQFAFLIIDELLNLNVLVRNVDKNCSSISKLSYLFFLNTEIKYFVEFKISPLPILAGEGKAEPTGQIWPCFTSNLLKSNFPEDLLCARKWGLSHMRCPFLVFKHLPSLKADTHHCRMPKHVMMPAITSLPSWQKHRR